MNSAVHVRTACLLTLLALLLSGPAVAALDPELLKGFEARSIGPAAVSGRIAAIDVVRSNPNHIVIGAATGGVWISHNGGLTWTAVATANSPGARWKHGMCFDSQRGRTVVYGGATGAGILPS